jgi:hypothetical protein
MNHYTVHYSTAPKHTAKRFSVYPGGPKLRAGKVYKATGFKMPPPTAMVAVHSAIPVKTVTSTVLMPKNFCYTAGDLTPALDQGICGSCWAHALMFSIADRVAIMTKGRAQRSLSIRQIEECSAYLEGTQPTGCEGNDFGIAADSLVRNKVPLVLAEDYPRPYTVQPTEATDCGTFTADTNGYYVTLSDASAIIDPIGQVGDEIHHKNIENMKQHIYNEGPIAVAMNLYNEFQNYDGLTIYEPSEAAIAEGTEGGHAIEIIGWGTEPSSGAQYWVCCNSWGPQWPVNHKTCAGIGYFYIRMGKNVMNIESWEGISSIPVVHNLEKAPTTKETDIYPGEEFACRGKTVVGVSEKALIFFNPMHSTSGKIAAAGLVLLIAAIAIYGYKKIQKS